VQIPTDPFSDTGEGLRVNYPHFKNFMTSKALCIKGLRVDKTPEVETLPGYSKLRGWTF
jgi:hypothetical protein